MLPDPSLRNPLAISLGAIAGALTRYYLTLWCINRFGGTFPYSTFLINLSGCFGLGFFVTFTLEQVAQIPREASLLVTTGFFGAYTTFSTYELESFVLLRRNGDLATASLYWAGSAVLGFISIGLGVLLARSLR